MDTKSKKLSVAQELNIHNLDDSYLSVITRESTYTETRMGFGGLTRLNYQSSSPILFPNICNGGLKCLYVLKGNGGVK
jgi:hypothetical protein